MIFTKLRLLACLSLACLASNVDAECNRAKGRFMLYTMWSTYLPKPLARRMEVHLDFNGIKCDFAQDYGAGDYMQSWTGVSGDGSCIVYADTLKNEIMIRYDGLIFGGSFRPDEIYDSPKGSYMSFQQLWYNGIDYSRGC